ncbi:13024_t:CDS:2, partial [Gigaspora rosea]
KGISNIDKDIFLRLIKRDDMDIEEIDIWKHLVNWGTAQLTASNEILIAVDLYEDLVAYFMANINRKVSTLPSRCGYINIDSVIIERDKAAIITKWIEKGDNFARKTFYQFILTYRVFNSEKIIGGYNPLGLRNMNDYNYINKLNKHFYHKNYARWETTDD